MLRKLDAQSCARLLAQLTDLGNSHYDYGATLAERGFLAFKANQAYLECLASNKEELALHRDIQIERAKERFANPFFGGAIYKELTSFEPPYKSNLLADLSREIDPDHKLREEIRSTGKWDEEWRLEIDPCLRALGHLGFQDKELRRRDAQDEFRRLRKVEIEHFLQPPHLGACPANDVEARDIAFDTLRHGIRQCGFELDAKVSSAKTKMFTKPVVGDWIMNMTILADDFGFGSYGFEIVDGQKRISPKIFQFHLDLRLKTQKGLVTESLTNLPIKFSELSPLGESSYSAYLDMDEMSVGILGYVELYGLMQAELEGRLRQGISEM